MLGSSQREGAIVANIETVEATSEKGTESFQIDWDTMTWTGKTTHAEGEFPYIAHVRGKRYELYSDNTFNEEQLAKDP